MTAHWGVADPDVVAGSELEKMLAVNFPVIRDEPGERPMWRRRAAGGTDQAPPSGGDREPAGLNP
jgi:hypothetical protein